MNGRPRRSGEEACDVEISDGELLARFVEHDDEAAFAELVTRYGGLVLGVCRRTLRDEHGAEDAFQAVFLVLAQKASEVRKRSSLGGWLYAVAYRTALRAKSKQHRRREEALGDEMTTTTDDPFAQVASRHEQQLLDEELHRLPQKYREPLVLRYLLGKSNQEVADALKLRLGVVEGRLKRGKDRLRLELAKRGIGVAVALAALGAAQASVEAATIQPLAAKAAETALTIRAGAQPAAGYSQNALQLAQQELAMKTTAIAATLSTATVALVVAGITLASTGGAVAPKGNGGGRPAASEVPRLKATVQAAPSAKEGRAAPVKIQAAKKLGIKSGKEVPSRFVDPKIEAALSGPTDLGFIDTPLADVGDVIAQQHDIHVRIDQRALDDVGIEADAPITFDMKDVSLESALNLMLRDLDLTWLMRDETLLITTPEEAEQALFTKVYPVSDLVIYQDTDSGNPWADYLTLTQLITKSIAPETWTEVGGPGSLEPAPMAGAEMLAISQTYPVHRQIDRLLEDLRATAKAEGNDLPPVRQRPMLSSSPAMGTEMGMGMEGVGGHDRIRSEVRSTGGLLAERIRSTQVKAGRKWLLPAPPTYGDAYGGRSEARFPANPQIVQEGPTFSTKPKGPATLPKAPKARDPIAMLASLTEISFQLDSPDRNRNSHINLMVERTALEAARQTGLTPSEEASAVMSLKLEFDELDDPMEVHLSAKLTCPDPGPRLAAKDDRITLWAHQLPIGKMPGGLRNRSSASHGLPPALSEAVYDFFDQFLKDHAQARAAKADAATGPKR